MESKVETKDLAEFYGVTRQSVEKWTPEKRKQKTVQALSGAEQSICDMIADISKLAYIYDCQWLHGAEQKRWCWIHRTPQLFACYLYIKGEGIEFTNESAALKSISETVLPTKLTKVYLQELEKLNQ